MKIALLSVTVVFVSVLMMPDAQAATGFLSGERNGGMTKVCYYNVLGETYELNLSSTTLCPLSHEFVVAPRPNYNAPTQNNNNGRLGFLKGHQTQGMSQICYYDVLGEVQEVTISAAAICPINLRFPPP